MNESDTRVLQEDIDSFSQWRISNKIYLNSSKCYHIKLTRNRNSIQYLCIIQDKTLTEVRVIRDFGIFLNSKVSFTEYLNNINFCISVSWIHISIIKRIEETIHSVCNCAIVMNKACYITVVQFGIPYNKCISIESETSRTDFFGT